MNSKRTHHAHTQFRKCHMKRVSDEMPTFFEVKIWGFNGFFARDFTGSFN